MLLLIVRGLAVANAVGTVIPILTGALTDPTFIIADLILAVVLVIAALLPARWAPPALLAGNSYAAGVFTIALGNQMQGGAINPLLVFALVICAASLVLLALKPGSRSVS